MHHDYRTLAAFVRRIHRGVYTRRVVQAGIVLLSLFLLLPLLGIGLQPLLPVAPVVALLYCLFTLTVVIGLGGYVLVRALPPVPKRHVLTAIEQTYPDLHDDLTNALELDPAALERSNPRGIGLDLVRALHRRTAQHIQGYSPKAVIRRQPLRGMLWCSLLCLTFGLVAVIQPQLLSTAFHMLLQPASYLPIRAVHITIHPEQTTIARGTNVEIRASATERAPRSMTVVVQRDGQPPKRHPMEPLGQGRFRYVVLKPQTSFAFEAQTDGSTSPQGQVTVVPAPAIGHLSLQYLFPEYTGLPQRTQAGGGDIQALPGTQVQLTMQTNVPVTKGLLRFANGNELPLTITNQTLHGEILVMEEGTYRIAVEDTHGLPNTNPPQYTVHVQPDLPPTVKIHAPSDGTEIDETSVVTIRFEAEDDFGLQDAALVYAGADGVERRIALHQGRFDHRQAVEKHVWDIYQHPLPAGAIVQVYVEVYDNDTISGPKKGVSKTLTLKIRNREQEHQALEQLQEEMADALLDLLADHLELAEQVTDLRESPSETQDAPSPREGLQQAQELQRQAMERAEHVAEQLETTLNKVQHDPYSTYETYADLQSLQRNMTTLQQELLPKLQRAMQPLTAQPHPSDKQLDQAHKALEDVVQELERLSAFSEDIANAEKLHDLMNLSTKMMEQQNQLLASLDNLPKDFQGGEIPPDVQKMLDQLDELMQDLANTLAQLPQSLPDEFLNQQLDTLPMAEMMQQLEQIKQKLAEGDVEGAKRLAEQLLKTLSTMVNSMQNMLQQARGGAMDAMAQQLQQSSDALAQLIQRQDAILQETQQVDQTTLQQLNRAQRQAFEGLQQSLNSALNALSKTAWELARQARQHPELTPNLQRVQQQLLKQLHGLRKHLSAHELPQALEQLEAAEQQLTWLQRRAAGLSTPDEALQRQAAHAVEQLQHIRRRIDQLPQNRQAMLTPDQRDQLEGLGTRQGAVRQDTESLHQAFQELTPLMPFLPTKIGQNLQEATPFMQQAHDELVDHSGQRAIPPEQDALERLRDARESLQQALQQMAQRSQMMGMSMPMLRQAGRFPMPNGMMSQPQVNQQQAGAAGASVRNFQLPDKEAYKVPKMFREDIIEALRQGYPERYKALIEQYYRNIVR